MENTVLVPATRRERRVIRRTRAEMIGAVICKIEDLLFPVEIREEEMPSNSEYSQRVIGQIDGGDFLLNQCSPYYELIPNNDIFPEIEKILDAANIQYVATYRHIDHVRFFADYRFTDPAYGYKMKGTNDAIQPMLRVQHSYNGKTKYRIILGYFRLICTNGLMIAVEEMKRFKLVLVGKHTKEIQVSLETLKERLKFFVAEAPIVIAALTGKYELLGGRAIKNVEDRVKEVLAAAKIRMVDNSKFNTVASIVETVMEDADGRRRFEDGTYLSGYNGQANDWLIYNAINQYINDDKRNIVAPDTRMDTDSKVLEYMLHTNMPEMATAN